MIIYSSRKNYWHTRMKADCVYVFRFDILPKILLSLSFVSINGSPPLSITF